MTGTSSEHGIHIRDGIAQLRVLEIILYNLVCRPIELLIMTIDVFVFCSQIEKIYLVNDMIEFFYIVAYSLFLFRKLTLEIADKIFFSLRDMIGLTITNIGDFIHAVGIYIMNLQIFHDSKIFTDLIDGSVFSNSTQQVHTCLKLHAMTGEGL